ncbi:phosphoribosyltransferase [Flavobacteriaceae bacterium M23B6Z8]
MSSKLFHNRKDAGEQLAVALRKYEKEDVVVLAIPRGGLPLGYIISKELGKPLDVVLTKKIGHPFNKEYAIGAVSLESKMISDTIDISERYIAEETARLRALLEQRYHQYYQNIEPVNFANKTVIIVDDGIATGNTLIATIELVAKKLPTKIVVAVPVAPSTALKKIKNQIKVNEVVCLHIPSRFRAVGAFYCDFSPVSDREAITLLEKSRRNYEVGE